MKSSLLQALSLGMTANLPFNNFPCERIPSSKDKRTQDQVNEKLLLAEQKRARKAEKRKLK